MTPGPHPYQELSMTTTGLVLGLTMVIIYGLMWKKPEAAQKRARTLARDWNAGVYAMGIGMVWFWLLVAPEGNGLLAKLAMPLNEFSGMKRYLQILIPLAALGMIFYVREFLFVRGLGLCFLMAAAPILYSAFLKEPGSRVLLSLVAYAMIVKGLFFVGMPYLYRDGVAWLSASQSRWKVASLTGLTFGALILICSITVWRGY